MTKLQGTTTSDYSLPDVATGEWFGQYLWGAFGPYNSSLSIERPFDYDDVHVELDGFDFDIEQKFGKLSDARGENGD